MPHDIFLRYMSQEASECVLVTVLEASNMLAIHAKRHTLMAKDIKAVNKTLAFFGHHF